MTRTPRMNGLQAGTACLEVRSGRRRDIGALSLADHDFRDCARLPESDTIARCPTPPIKLPTRKPMRKTCIAVALTSCFVLAAPAFGDDEPAKKETKTETKTETAKTEKLMPKQVETEGSVMVEGKKIDYKAVAGTIILDDK